MLFTQLRLASRRSFSTFRHTTVLKAPVQRSSTGRHLEFVPKTRRLRFRTLKRVIGGSTLLIGGGLALIYNSDEGLARSMYFYSNAVPPYLHYRYVQFLTRNDSEEEQTRQFEILHKKYRDVPIKVILELKGFYTKFGQIISGLDGGIVPKEYVESLKVLQSDVPPEPFHVIRDIVEDELQCKLEDVFSEFDRVPVGAASIGQVHMAKLLDGTEVVVKVQYPSTEKFFRLDIATLKSFCKIAQPEQLVIFDEIEKQFMSEFDYTVEAQQLRQAAKNMEKEYKMIKIPAPLDSTHESSPRKEGLCTRKVLVMEKLIGKSLQKSLREYLHKMAIDQDKTVQELEDEMRKEITESPENVKVPAESTIRFYRNLLKFKDVVRNTAAFAYNWTLGWIGAPIEYEHTLAPLNSYWLLDLVYKAHAHQLFFDGFFNGDPHPGNIMLLEDGKVGLIDYGQVKKMEKSDRIKLAKLVVALADEDDDLVVQRWQECGFETENSNPRVIRASAYFNFDRWTPDIVDEFGGLALFQETLDKTDHVTHLPNEYIMAFRLSALMRINAMGMGHISGKYAHVCKVWREQAALFLDENGESY